ncbi:hypothetical protein CPB86DRAFT_783849 [Serendipita vermifera]|nr:hypothetical protein CPB86DRAFT_783849 [Serendipita vermifera]
MSSLKVSIPEHLRQSLEPLIELLPPELVLVVQEALKGNEILYDTIVNVSKWAVTDEGRAALEDKKLNPRDYDRISLLAGTITGPSKRLPPPEPKPEPWEVAQDEKNTRRAVAALFNGLFSVIGVGVAVWWAGRTAGWSDNLRLTLSICAGLFTGLVEAALFGLYYNRRGQAREYRAKVRQRKHQILQRRYQKKYGDNEEVPEVEIKPEVEDPSAEGETTIRRRLPLQQEHNSAEDS